MFNINIIVTKKKISHEIRRENNLIISFRFRDF
jgi:hypothetical protein